MAKGIGLIGNFRGKVGNMVGYNLKDSNNKQTQGVRVYQPVVKNPKTAGQAEQRAKLAPINATYRALKMIIDRGQEGKAYGNKSRLAWLSEAMKAFNGGWYEKGASMNEVALVPLTKGSIPVSFPQTDSDVIAAIHYPEITGSLPSTMGAISALLIQTYPALQIGDQLTFVRSLDSATGIQTRVDSIVLTASDNTDAIPSIFVVEEMQFGAGKDEVVVASAVIVSREGENGEHLRNTTALQAISNYNNELIAPAAKAAAIKSYMSQGANTDWAEESLQD